MIIRAYLIVVTVMSGVCFIVYGFDKRRAKRGGRRVPERTLHLLEFLGGWPGAFYAQQWFRHKTQKVSFRKGFRAVFFSHIAIVGISLLVLLLLPYEKIQRLVSEFAGDFRGQSKETSVEVGEMPGVISGKPPIITPALSRRVTHSLPNRERRPGSKQAPH